MRTWKWVSLWLSFGSALTASADPLVLQDMRPRDVLVAFEISPTERPDVLDAIYSEPLPAWLEPGAPGQVRVRVPGRTMEQLLVGYDPLPGSFADYVWTFDTATGEVIEASFQGRLHHPVALGFFVTHVETRIDVRVGTRETVGFRRPRTTLGQVVVGACLPAPREECTPVRPAPLDPYTGYVNAVGTIEASALGGLGARTFSPLGEAIFSELPDTPPVSLAAD